MVTFADKVLVWTWAWRDEIVVTLAMPILAPMLRIRLNRLVALPICSLGMRPLVMVVSGTNSSPMDMPCKSCGQKMSQYPAFRLSLESCQMLNEEMTRP